MFESITPAPPDPILGLTDAFKADPNPRKINLGVGIYKDDSGKTPVLQSVSKAEAQILATQTDKSYKPIDGDAAFAKVVQQMMFGANHPLLASGRIATSHTPGGTGALRVVGDYLHQNHPSSTIWMTDPTWANHPKIFEAAGLQTKTFTYFDPTKNALDFDAMMDALRKIPAGDVVLLHGCCHNPTGADPTLDQWKQMARLLADRRIVPLVDFAYQGFGDGLDEDAAGLRALVEVVPELFICTSYSKNFSLYNERVGAMSIIAADAKTAAIVQSRVKVAIRTNYSNPPAHGATIITMILNDPQLTALWHQELADMRNRINAMRTLFTQTLAAKGAGRDFSFITRQRGMFSYSGLNKEQVAALKEKFAIYIVGSGRISVAGMARSNMDRLCEAIVSVL